MSSAAGMHFQVRIQTELLDLDQIFPCPESFQRLALLGAAIFARLPGRPDERRNLLEGNAVAQRLTQVKALFGIQTQIPHAVRGEPAAITGGAEGHRRRRNDPEGRAVGQ